MLIVSVKQKHYLEEMFKHFFVIIKTTLIFNNNVKVLETFNCNNLLPNLEYLLCFMMHKMQKKYIFVHISLLLLQNKTFPD